MLNTHTNTFLGTKTSKYQQFSLGWVSKECAKYSANIPGGWVGNDTPRLRVPAARIFKELPCFGVKFSNIHPASESDFLSGIFSGESIVIRISFVMLIFLLFSNPFFWGGANCLREKTAVSRTMYQNTEMSCFQRKP